MNWASKQIKFKFVKFAGLGLFVFAWGITFNILQVELLQISKQTAYTLVVVSQIFLGFFLGRYYVFNGRHKKVVGVFLGYLAVLTFFRAADWLLYFVAVQWLSMPYVLAEYALFQGGAHGTPEQCARESPGSMPERELPGIRACRTPDSISSPRTPLPFQPHHPKPVWF